MTVLEAVAFFVSTFLHGMYASQLPYALPRGVILLATFLFTMTITEETGVC